MNKQKQQGFTLVEIMLAMAFIAFLLLFVVNVVMQVTRLYTKGMAVRQINQSGRQVMEDMTRSLRYATTPKVANGRLCVDGITYVWNIEGAPITNNKYAAPNAAKLLRFVSFQDTVGKYCDQPTLALPYDEAKDLIGPELTVMRFAVRRQGTLSASRLWDIDLVIATAGSNKPTTTAAVPPALPTIQCDPNNHFCAFGEFSTSVYSRGE